MTDARSLHAVRRARVVVHGQGPVVPAHPGHRVRREAPGSDRYLNEIVPTVGRWIIPCMETPDGTIIQDGADIIDHFERGPGQSLRRYNAYPTSPLLLAVAHVFELFGGEGLLRPAMHYRWNFDDENLAFLTSEFALFAPQNLSAEEAEQVFLHSSGRMRKAAAGVRGHPRITTADRDGLPRVARSVRGAPRRPSVSTGQSSDHRRLRTDRRDVGASVPRSGTDAWSSSSAPRASAAGSSG